MLNQRLLQVYYFYFSCEKPSNINPQLILLDNLEHNKKNEYEKSGYHINFFFVQHRAFCSRQVFKRRY